MKKNASEYKPKLPQYLLELAREFRKNPTATEKMMWECLGERRLYGFKFRRQHPIRRYIADFYCHKAALVVELDGSVHDAPDRREDDQIREQELRGLDLTVLRVRNEQIKNELERVLEEIAEHLLPSPRGRGAGGEGRGGSSDTTGNENKA